MTVAQNLSDQDIIRRDERASAATTVLSLDSRRSKVGWEREVLRSVLEYLKLPEGWDSYEGKPLRYDTGMFAIQVLASAMSDSTPAPSVVPVSSGGLQFEWHRNNFDIELYIAAPFDCELSIQDHLKGGPLESIQLKTDMSPLVAVLSQLSNINRHLYQQANAS